MSSSSSAPANQRFVLAVQPSGKPDDSTFKLEEIDVPKPSKDGEILIKSLYVSVDPYLRGMMRNVPVGQPIVSGQVGEVVESKSSDFAVGDHVLYYGAWQRLQVIDTSKKDPLINTSVSKVDGKAAPLSTYLGVLGMPGRTAYFGLKDVAAFQKGDIVLVSGAAGAVGSLVGQLAKLWGAKKVVGVAGGPEKCKLLTETLGFDASIDYKQFDSDEKMRDELKRISPEGYDVYFDNTGGHTTNAWFDNVRKYGRMALCGQISNYNDVKPQPIPNPFMKMIYTSVTVRGFIQADREFINRTAEFEKVLQPLVKDGTVKYQETVENGFENIPKVAFSGLFTGSNTGKMVIKV